MGAGGRLTLFEDPVNIMQRASAGSLLQITEIKKHVREFEGRMLLKFC